MIPYTIENLDEFRKNHIPKVERNTTSSDYWFHNATSWKDYRNYLVKEKAYKLDNWLFKKKLELLLQER